MVTATISALRTLPRNKKQDERDQQDAIGQIAQDGMGGVVHQVAAIQMRNEFHSRREAGPSCVRH